MVVIGSQASATVPLTRNALQNMGISIAGSAIEGQFVVCELTGGSEFEPWMIGEVVEEAHNANLCISLDDNYMGYVKPGDFVIKLQVGPRLARGGHISVLIWLFLRLRKICVACWKRMSLV